MIEKELNGHVEELTKSKSKINICDWDRGCGKSTTMFEFINRKCLNEKCNILLLYDKNISIMINKINNYYTECKYLKNINKFIMNRNDGKVKYFNGSNIDIKTFNADFIRGMNIKYDYIIIDDNYSYKNLFLIKDLEINIKPTTQFIFTLSSNDRPDINIIKYNKDDNINEETFKKETLSKLINEYNTLPNNKTTTMTRLNILNMIKIIKEL